MHFKKKERDSNLELLRILAMLAIIAHHYVVNSTVRDYFDYDNPTAQQYFLQVWGMWGKTAINSFILISGYFMCRMTLTWQRYFKLFVQIMFYGIAIMLIFAVSGYAPLSPKILIKQFFGLFIHINSGFTASFMVFYAFLPLYNKLINNIDKRQFEWLVGGLLFVFTICSSFFKANTMNEPFWYMTLYFVAAYIRNYPNRYFGSLKLWAWILAFGVVASIISVIGITEVGRHLQMEKVVNNHYFFVSDSNKILAFIVGLSAFLVAKNLPTFHSKIINIAAAGTFGVLLIHAASSTMRKWLWQDVCNVPGMLQADMRTLILQALMVPLIVFSVCSFIDYFYRKWIEKPVMRYLHSDNHLTRKITPIFS